MIKKYNVFLNEKLTDNLSGFNSIELKQQFLDGKITINRYKQICKEHNIELPTEDEILSNVKNYSKDINEILKYASENNVINGIKYAIENGADVKYDDEITLYNAVRFGDLDIFKYLIENSNINISKNILNEIITYNGYNILKYLIEEGINIDTIVNDYNQTILILAAKKNKFEIIKILVENGADIHYDEDNALTFSAYNENIENVKYLLEHGAIVHEFMFDLGFSFKIKKILKEYYKKQTGKNFDEYAKYNENLNEKLTDNLKGFNKEELKQQFENGEIDMFKYLKLCKKYNYDIDEIISEYLEKHDITDLLNLSIENKYIDGIKYVFENSYGLSDEYLNNTLVEVASFGDIDIIKYLVDLGADVHTDNEQALLNAVRYNTQDVIRYLNEQGADINLLDQNYIFEVIDTYDNYTFNYIKDNYKLNNFLNKMLVKTSSANNIRLFKILIENGADVHYNDELPLQTAVYEYNFNITKLLLENGANILKYLYTYVNSNSYLNYQYPTAKKIKELINNNYKQNEEIDLSKFGYTKEQLVKEISDVYTIDKSEKSIDKY